MKGPPSYALAQHWQVAAGGSCASCGSSCDFFFKVLYVKGAPAMVWCHGNQFWVCTPLLPRGLEAKRKEGWNIWDGWSLVDPMARAMGTLRRDP